LPVPRFSLNALPLANSIQVKEGTLVFKLLDLLLGFCTHDRCTFPMRPKPGQRRSEAARATGVYIVCLHCGKEFPYSWEEMRVVSTPNPRRMTAKTSDCIQNPSRAG